MGFPGYSTLEHCCACWEPQVSCCVCISYPREGAGRVPAASPLGGDGRLGLQPGGAHCCLSTEHGTPALLPYQFHMEEIEGFRYRCRVSGQGSGLLWDGHPSSASVLTLCPSRTPCAR